VVMLAFGLATLNHRVCGSVPMTITMTTIARTSAPMSFLPLGDVEAYETLCLAKVSLCRRTPSADACAGIHHGLFLRDVRDAARGQPEATLRRGSLDRLPCGDFCCGWPPATSAHSGSPELFRARSARQSAPTCSLRSIIFPVHGFDRVASGLRLCALYSSITSAWPVDALVHGNIGFTTYIT